MLNQVETGRRLAEFWTVVFPSVSIKDRPLLSYFIVVNVMEHLDSYSEYDSMEVV